ncbi:MAG TPA: DUF4760 domain-containing protein [Candidatus Eremiobacteraceae bacterium]|nr:DUF4760 domain-containing protein [Candidatus Eremiobacteraceae bacterium]
MSIEAWNTLLSGSTFAVVAAAAIAAIVQLRHLRASNQLNALLTVLETWQDSQFQECMKFVRDDLQEKVKDPTFLESLRDASGERGAHPELLVCDWFEQVGSYMKHGLLDERLFLDLISGTAVRYWRKLAPVTSQLRARRGAAVYENFEYLAVRGRIWNKKFPDGTYPRGTPRFAELEAMDAGTPGVASKP